MGERLRGVVFGVIILMVVLLVVGIIVDAHSHRVARRVGTVVRVKVRSIKTPHIRVLHQNNRLIVDSGNEMLVAITARHEQKREDRREAMRQWSDEWRELDAKSDPEPILMRKKDYEKLMGSKGRKTMKTVDGGMIILDANSNIIDYNPGWRVR